MDSYTLFGHVVDVAGIMTCQRAHIELQALGVLPEASLENNPPLKQEDADARAALALWCGLVHNPELRYSSKEFFTQLGEGNGRAPMSADNDNFLLDLAEILRRGPEALGVESIFLSRIVTNADGFNGRAMIEYSNGSTENYTVGQVYLSTHLEGVLLDFKRLRALHEDLLSTPRTWPEEVPTAVSRLRFKNGQIEIKKNERRK